MKKIKEFIKKLFLPSGVAIGFLMPFSVAGLFYIFITHTNVLEKIIAITIAIYTLTVILVRIPAVIEFLKSVQKNNVFVNKFTTDPFLRVKISLPTSIIFDVIYAAVQCVIGLVTMSFWFYILAGYYAALIVMRLFLLREFRPGLTKPKNGLQIRLFIGISLLFMNIALIGVVFYIVNYGRGFTTGWLFSLIILSYTIGALITATYGVIKYRKLCSSALTASKVINFTAAAVSILILETVLIDTFGSAESMEFRRHVTLITGICVCTFVLILSLYLIFSQAKIKRRTRKRSSINSEAARCECAVLQAADNEKTSSEKEAEQFN